METETGAMVVHSYCAAARVKKHSCKGGWQITCGSDGATVRRFDLLAKRPAQAPKTQTLAPTSLRFANASIAPLKLAALSPTSKCQMPPSNWLTP